MEVKADATENGNLKVDILWGVSKETFEKLRINDEMLCAKIVN